MGIKFKTWIVTYALTGGTPDELKKPPNTAEKKGGYSQSRSCLAISLNEPSTK
jgi:hypothetical protein